MSTEFDMHNAGALRPVPDDRLLPEGVVLSGCVVCHYDFGLGVYIPSAAADHTPGGIAHARESLPPGRHEHFD